MSTIGLRSVRAYKWKTPLLSQESGVGAIFIVLGGSSMMFPFPLTRFRSRRALSAFVKEALDGYFWFYWTSGRMADQIVDYLLCNFSFRDLQAVPPASPGLVFVVSMKQSGMVGEATDDYLLWALNEPLTFSAAANKEGQELVPVPVLAPTAEVVDGAGGECCSVCKLGFAWEEAVLRTICSHIFHVRCIAPCLSRHRSCPVCSSAFPRPLDVRILLH